MPIYEYQCQACQHTLESIQKMTEAPLTDCPACHQPELQRLVSAAGFQLKGTGWYATDFKNAGKPKTEPQPAAKSTTDVAKSSEASSAPAKESTAGSSGNTKSGGSAVSGTTKMDG